ncbi:MAG TPA: ABC transporter permease [Gammaproteobacteria bacterium]|nr:ABC transporter permease [Gammaproteobacteria bacterium]
MHAIVHEMRQAVAQLRQSPGFTALAVAILGLGLGATIYMFTVVKAYMLTPLPYPDAARIMHIERANPLHGFDSLEVTQHDFVEWRHAQRSFEELAAFYPGTVNISGGDLPERYDGAFIAPSAFDVTDVAPLLGRVLEPSDAEQGAPAVVVLGFDVWMNRYNGDPEVLGDSIRVNGIESVVVGVMPAGFRFPLQEAVWVPLKIDLTQFARGQGQTVEVFGRLKAGVTQEQARSEFANIAAALAAQYPENENITTVIKPYQDEYIQPEARAMIATMFVAVLFVLMIACANVANLILARTVARRKDIALRAALGASRGRILVHVLTEGVVLALAGSVVAYFLADIGLDVTDRAFVAADIQEPFWIDLAIDWRVLLFAAGAALIAGVIAGIMPALRAIRTDVNEYLKEGAKGSGASASRLSRTLVTFEIALSCILLVSAGLMIRSVVNLNGQPLGIEHTNLLTGRIGLPEAQYGDPAAQHRFFEQLVERLESDPGVLGATAAYSYPGMDAWTFPYRTREMSQPESGQLPFTNYAGAMDNYADTLGMQLVQGRWFDGRDHADGEPVTVIDARLAEEAFAGVDPVGRQINIGDPDDADAPWRTVIGVVNNVLLDERDDVPRGAAFVPSAQDPQRFITVAAHTRGNPMALAQTLRETVRSIDTDIPVYWLRTLDNWVWAGNFTSRIVSTLFGIFAIIAVVLAAAGIYGVLAYSVSQRTREIGVRRAMGAIDGRILRMVLGQGLAQLGIGLAAGLLCAVGFARLLSSMLHGVTPFDPVTLAAVALLLFAVALIASLLPALRALRVNPMQALRYE